MTSQKQNDPSADSSVAESPAQIEYDFILTADGLVFSVFVPYDQIGVLRGEEETDDEADKDRSV